MTNAELSPLVEVVERLLAPGGCSWDRAQTHASMRKHMIEEAYEVCDAIDRKDAENLREELGDVLYQVVFHAVLAEEEGAFDMQAVIDGNKRRTAGLGEHQARRKSCRPSAADVASGAPGDAQARKTHCQTQKARRIRRRDAGALR